jgi:hypothetical protein
MKTARSAPIAVLTEIQSLFVQQRFRHIKHGVIGPPNGKIQFIMRQ